MKKLIQALTRPTALVAAVILAGCQSFEYSENIVTISDSEIYVENVGFKGFKINPPAGFELLLSDDASPYAETTANDLDTTFLIPNQNTLDYRYHQGYAFKVGEILVTVQPIDFKFIQQFRYVPDDRRELFLSRWFRDKEFAEVYNLGLDFGTESSELGHSWLSVSTVRDGGQIAVFKQVMTGDLKEVFQIVGIAPIAQQQELKSRVNQLRESITVLR